MLDWTKIDEKFTEKGLSPLDEDTKEIFNKAIIFKSLNQKYKEFKAQKNDPNIDEETLKSIKKESQKFFLEKSSAQNCLTTHAPQKIAAIILTQKPENQASIMHLIMSEIWNEFPIISRFKLFTRLIQNAQLVNLTSTIDPVTNTNGADIVLPTISNISSLTVDDDLNESIAHNIALFNFILPKVHNPNLTDKDGTNALTAAAKSNAPSIIKQLLDKGATIDQNDSSIITTLIDNFYKNTTAITNFDLPSEVALSLWLAGSLNAINEATTTINNFRPEDIHHKPRADGYSLHAENMIKIINMLIDKGLDINKFNDSGMNLFFFASHPFFINNNWMIDKIINLPTFDPNAQNSSGATILSWACQHNKSDSALKIINHPSFDIKISPPQGYLPFLATLNSPKIAKILTTLCDKGLNINAQINTKDLAGQTLFYLACKNQNIELAKAVASHPHFDITMVTSQGDSPFIIALDYLTNTEILDILASRGAPLTIKNFQGYDALSTAIYHGKIEMATWVQSKVKLNNPLKDTGFYPLHIATHKGNIEAVKWLLDNGYNVNQTTCTKAKLTSIKIAEYLNDNKEAIITLLKEKGASEEVEVPVVNQQTANGQTTFMLFCTENNTTEALEQLNDEAGIDVTIVDNEGNGIIHYATILSDIDGAKTIISCAIAKGSDIDARNFAGQTPLIHSLYIGREDIAIALLDLATPANITIPDNNGAYPIHIAAAKGQISVLEKLLSQGADINCTSSNFAKESPLKIAQEVCKKDAIVEWLLDHGAKDVVNDDFIPTEAISLVELGGDTSNVTSDVV